MKQYRMLVVATLCAALTAGHAWAEGDQKAGRERFREEHKAEWEAFQAERQTGNEAFKKSLEGLTGNARIDAVIKHKEEEMAARMEFKKGMNEKRIAEMKEKMAAEGVSAEKQAEALANQEKRNEEHMARATERNAEAIAKLQAIKDDGSLTDAQKDEAVKKLWEEAQAERKERRANREKGEGETHKAE